jgi:hypothetical protein
MDGELEDFIRARRLFRDTMPPTPTAGRLREEAEASLPKPAIRNDATGAPVTFLEEPPAPPSAHGP